MKLVAGLHESLWRSAATKLGAQSLDSDLLFLVELVEQPLLAQIERSAWLTIGLAAPIAIVETPARGAAGFGSVRVGDEIHSDRLPLAKATAKRFLIVHGNH